MATKLCYYGPCVIEGCTPSHWKKECKQLGWEMKRSELFTTVHPEINIGENQTMLEENESSITLDDMFDRIVSLVMGGSLFYVSIGTRRADGKLLVTLDTALTGKLYISDVEPVQATHILNTILSALQADNRAALRHIRRTLSENYYRFPQSRGGGSVPVGGTDDVQGW